MRPVLAIYLSEYSCTEIDKNLNFIKKLCSYTLIIDKGTNVIVMYYNWSINSMNVEQIIQKSHSLKVSHAD